MAALTAYPRGTQTIAQVFQSVSVSDEACRRGVQPWTKP